jgi:hypothetical protein
MANRVRVEINLLASLDVGQAWVFMQEEYQGSPLAKLEADGPAADGLLGQGDEVGGKHGAVGR